MPISRDARMDRRRRLLRDTVEADSVDDATPRRASRRTAQADEPEGLLPKRKAGYSQDVRRACGQRLVQLIPVRRRSFAAVAFISILIPALLLAAHYLVHVTGQLQWWRHPLAVALDIGHPRSIAAWLCSQLWLLCLGATVLTFQLRRHKLDDYNGEYRLWFWLVLTCLLASVDATTSITDLFALALDPWAQAHLGWSGPAVVDLTLAVLIGMLGLRMCSELKAVPLSLLWWLGGLVVWACSAALARPEFQLEMSAPIRYWLISAFWLAGLTMIWLAALTYLRSIYVEAQQRFLLRGRLATSGMPLGQRLRESLPNWPRLVRDPLSADARHSPEAAARTASRWALPSVPAFLRRGGNAPAAAEASGTPQSSSRRRTRKSDESAAPADERDQQPPSEQPKKLSRLTGWLRRPKDNDEAEEYRKVKPDTEAKADHQKPRPERQAPTQSSRKTRAEEASTEDATPAAKRGWLPKLSRPQLPLPKLSLPKLARPKLKLPKFSGRSASDEPQRKNQPEQKKGGFLARLKIPKLSLAALKLQPPEDDAPPAARPAHPPAAMRPIDATPRQLPSTESAADSDEDYDDEEQEDGRPLSKAERKRLRRNQQQRRSA